jgi:hypothetical protein
VSDSRSQMVDWNQDDKPAWARKPAWWDRMTPEQRIARRLMPYHLYWSKFDDEDSLDNSNDPAVLQKAHDDAMADADETDRDRAKGASPEEVARIRQTRQRGQRFRTDERVQSHGSNDYEFLEGEEGAEKWQKTKKL